MNNLSPAALADKSADADQVLNLAAIIREVDGNNSKGAAALAELILEHPGFRAVLARWGTPNSAETRRSLGEPAAGEVAELVAWLRGANWDRQRQTLATHAADLLERLSPPQPVPVSERLPGPEVCVPHPRTKRGNWCWGFERCEVSLARPARWRLMHMETVEMEASHWLPAHALPLPEVAIND